MDSFRCGTLTGYSCAVLPTSWHGAAARRGAARAAKMVQSSEKEGEPEQTQQAAPSPPEERVEQGRSDKKTRGSSVTCVEACWPCNNPPHTGGALNNNAVITRHYLAGYPRSS